MVMARASRAGAILFLASAADWRVITAPRSRTVIPAAAVTGILGRDRRAPMLGGPGTICGNHRAHSPRHPKTPPAMISAGQVHEPAL